MVQIKTSLLSSIIFLGLLLASCSGNNPLILPTDTAVPPTQTAAPSPTPTPAADTLAGFNIFMQEIESLKPGERPDLVNRYMAQIAQAPLTLDNRAVFLWRGAADTVHIVGDMNNWRLDETHTLTRIEGSDLWFFLAEYEVDARLEYQYVINNVDWQLDPLNPNSMASLTGPNSVLEMPRYETPEELQPGSSAPEGRIETHLLDSSSLNQTRTVFIYQPAGQLVGQQLPVIVFNNGSEYLNLVDAPVILDQLISKRLIPPLVAVFVPAINASQDYELNDAYVKFLADELIPFVKQNLTTSQDAESIGIIGAGDGGRAAIHAAVSRPDVFGLAVSQSGLFGSKDLSFLKEINQLEAGSNSLIPSQYYLIVGTYETAIEHNGLQANALQANRQMTALLKESGYETTLVEKPEGHGWGFWRGTMGQALSSLLN